MNINDYISDAGLNALVDGAMAEDLAGGEDVTSNSLVPEQSVSGAVVVAREHCVVAGIPVAEAVFRHFDSSIRVNPVVSDGDSLGPDDAVIRLSGSSRGILTAERTALNFMQRMTGIASMTAEFVRIASPFGCEILDTRKTTPGLRMLEKYAVACGGGRNHRMGLYDMVLIKDNHRKLWGAAGKDLGQAVMHAKERHPGLKIEIEVESMDELRSALEGAPDWVLLDNMSPDLMAACVAECAGRSRLEASGGITLENIGAVAASGVDAVSLGCLTHSAPAADLSLEFLEAPDK